MIDKITRDLYRREGLLIARNLNHRQGYISLIRKKADLLSLEDLAALRIINGRDSELCKKGTFVKEGMLYLPENKVYIVNDNSKIIVSRESKNFIITEDEIEFYFDSFQRVDNNFIDLENPRSNNLLKFMFGEFAEDYNAFLLSNGIRELELKLAKNIQTPLLLPIYLDSIANGSIIDASKNKSDIQEILLGYRF